MKAGKPRQAKVKSVMREWGSGNLRSGSKRGPVVPDTKAGQRQAVAIAISEARKGKGKK